MIAVPLHTVTAVSVRVSGQLLEGHLTYLEHVIRLASECGLWALVDLKHVVELDRAALFYLIRGEGHEFALVACPQFVRQWMRHEKQAAADNIPAICQK
jgi:hypothetical protein